MKITTAFMILGLSSLGMWTAATADAATYFYLNATDPASGLTNSQTYGTVALTQISAQRVDVAVNLAPNVFVNTGGDKNSTHTPFVFNLDATQGANAAVTNISPATCGNPPVNCFSAAIGPQPANPFGTFTNGINLNLPNGSGGTPSFNPTFLNFSVVNTTLAGISIASFIQNGLGAFFAADVSNGTNTGSVAALIKGPRSGGDPGEVPLPGALSLLVGGLGGMGWLARRQKRKGVTTV